MLSRILLAITLSLLVSSCNSTPVPKPPPIDYVQISLPSSNSSSLTLYRMSFFTSVESRGNSH